ncbi:putative F-box protein At2g33200 [Phoenix dactylifera]|uniref:F-box protein At2g33200 n=1 Tax=Phoenix dactylifera TaxID=42345 RepID=A0A8B8ZSK4_PHODC|nr:putative F-box protein At2g33200 [Phoenix dactylifera]
MDNHRETIVTIPDGFTNPLLHQEAAAVEENSSRWSDLSVDVLELILRRLGPVDHLRFGETCRSWRSARSLHRTRLDLPTPQLPWLLSGPTSFLSKGYRLKFFSPSDGRRYTISIPKRTPRQYWVPGSCANWLITDAGRDIFLVNPFTGVELRLPRIIAEREPNQDFAIAVSSHPGAPYGAVVLANLWTVSLICKRPGDRHWLWFHLTGEDRRVCQVAAVGRKFYGITHGRRLVDIDPDRSPQVVVMNQVGSILGNPQGRTHVFLVESDGDLLAVVMSCPNLRRSTPSFSFLRWDVETSFWEAIESIGDRLLFLGLSSSISVAAREHGVAGGRIYTIGPHSTGIYDLRTREGEVLCCCRSSSWRTWVAPRLFYWEGQADEISWWWDYAEEAVKVFLLALISVSISFVLCWALNEI